MSKAGANQIEIITDLLEIGQRLANHLGQQSLTRKSSAFVEDLKQSSVGFVAAVAIERVGEQIQRVNCGRVQFNELLQIDFVQGIALDVSRVAD